MQNLATGPIGESLNNDAAELQLLINDALAERNYRRAEELAVTREHRQQIVQTKIDVIADKAAARRARRAQQQSSPNITCMHSGQFSYCR